MAKLVILEPAQRELEEIASAHLRLSGPNSARKITDLIYDTLSRLEAFPLSGHPPRDWHFVGFPKISFHSMNRKGNLREFGIGVGKWANYCAAGYSSLGRFDSWR